jgi:hypothetical protein
MVDRGVAEGADHERVVGPGGRGGRGPTHAASPFDGEREPDRPGQVRGDGRGDRHDVQVRVSEHLVPAARDGFLGGRDEPAQHVAQWVAAGHLAGAGAVERPRAVVQQRRVAGAQRGRECGVALVAGRADRVVPLVEAAQPAGGEVEVAAGQLRVEQAPGLLAGERRAVAHRVLGVALVLRLSEAGQCRPEPLVEILRGGHVRSMSETATRLPPRTVTFRRPVTGRTRPNRGTSAAASPR